MNALVLGSREAEPSVPGERVDLRSRAKEDSQPSAPCEGCEIVRPLRPFTIFGFRVDLCGACSRGGFETAVAECWRSHLGGITA